MVSDNIYKITLTMKINIITLFPDFFKSPLQTGVLGRAVQSGFLKIRFVNPRDFSEDKHQNIDAPPYGGGDGMIMQYDPLKKALAFCQKEKQQSTSAKKKLKVYYLSPQGKKWDYKKARAFAESSNQELVFVCGRYGGVDQRFINKYVNEEISVGDYVLTGGEPAMLVVLDSLSRFIKGALGNELSAEEESFENQSLLEPPQWTKPKEITGTEKIPDVIFSGHHKNIQNFRYLLSVLVTAIKRPDLLNLNIKELSKALEMAKALSTEEQKACGIRQAHLKKITKLREGHTQNKGQQAEQVALSFFQKKGWKLKAQNQLIGGIEVDLIMEKPSAFLLVEVKSDNSWRREHPMSEKQKQRLSKAFSVFCEQSKKPVQILLAIVNDKKQVQTFNLEF